MYYPYQVLLGTPVFDDLVKVSKFVPLTLLDTYIHTYSIVGFLGDATGYHKRWKK